MKFPWSKKERNFIVFYEFTGTKFGNGNMHFICTNGFLNHEATLKIIKKDLIEKYNILNPNVTITNFIELSQQDVKDFYNDCEASK